MKLVERRIGLLFALFLLLLGAATARAAWLGTVKSRSLGDRALQQQVEDLVVPARRGTIYDRNGVELAVSEDAVTVFAHPFLIDDPAAVAARLAPLIGRSEDDLQEALGEPVSLIETERAEAGEDLRLTLDSAIQERVEAVLGEVGQTYQPAGATALVMDPRSGAILALANWPRVDANNVAGSPAYATQNRAIQFNYEPGSTFKAFTVAGALEEGLIQPDTPFQVPAAIQVSDRVIGEAHDGGGGTLTTADILARSSNVGTVMIGLKLGVTRFDRWVRRFWVLEPAGVDLPGENQGIVLDVEDYSGSSIGNMPIGQGISVTPIQMASAEGYTLAGKTGTAEKAENGTYSKTDFVASFIGYAPARNPQLLVSVMVDEPRGDIYGGTVAAPAFERIMEFALPYLKIPPQ